MFCPKCGSENLDANKFCRKCGKNLPDRAQIRQAVPYGYSPAPTPGFIGQVLDGKYRIDSKLGAGGMGDVYRATRLLIGDTVAVKILHPHLARDPQAAERFRREAVMATKLRHRNVVGIYDVGISTAHNIPYILMELAEGFTLRQIINQYRVLPLDFAVTVTTQVCTALDEAHGLGIVHRDIKPENIVANETTNGWHVKVLDFGIAKLYNQGDIGLTQDGTSMGTPQYMSPEQCMGDQLDARSDIYSVGIMLYEMLTGTVPFKSPTASAIAIHQVQTMPQAPRLINDKIHPEVEGVVLKSIWKQREHRQQKASQLAQELIKAATVAFKSGFTAIPEEPVPAPNIEPEFVVPDDPLPERTDDFDGQETVISHSPAAAPTVELIAANLAETLVTSESEATAAPPVRAPDIEPRFAAADDPSPDETPDFRGEKTVISHSPTAAPTVDLVGANLAETVAVSEPDTLEALPIEPPDERIDTDKGVGGTVESISGVKKPRRTTGKKGAKQKPVKIVADAGKSPQPVTEFAITPDEMTEVSSDHVVADDVAGVGKPNSQVQPPVIDIQTQDGRTSPVDNDYPATVPAEEMALVFAGAESLLDDLLTEATPAISAPVTSHTDLDHDEASPEKVQGKDVGSSPERESTVTSIGQSRENDQVFLPSFAAEPAGGVQRKYLIKAAAIGSGLLLFLISVPVLYYFFSGPGGQAENVPTNTGTQQTQGSPENAPPGMAFVPGGEFMMGSDKGDQNSRPSHKVSVKPFYMDITEVTNEEYKKFVDAEKYTAPLNWKNGTYPNGKAKFPVTNVTWDDASAYAKWAQKRLPTEEEWEFAARGTEGLKYPWGNDWKAGFANAGPTRALREVGLGDGKSPFGMFDMVGNAWEWTSDDLVAYPGGKLSKQATGMKVIRGGCYKSIKDFATTTYRYPWLARGAIGYEETSFRCVMDVPASSK